MRSTVYTVNIVVNKKEKNVHLSSHFYSMPMNVLLGMCFVHTCLVSLIIVSSNKKQHPDWDRATLLHLPSHEQMQLLL
jgi:hypothetical protein